MEQRATEQRDDFAVMKRAAEIWAETSRAMAKRVVDLEAEVARMRADIETAGALLDKFNQYRSGKDDEVDQALEILGEWRRAGE